MLNMYIGPLYIVDIVILYKLFVSASLRVFKQHSE